MVNSTARTHGEYFFVEQLRLTENLEVAVPDFAGATGYKSEDFNLKFGITPNQHCLSKPQWYCLTQPERNHIKSFWNSNLQTWPFLWIIVSRRIRREIELENGRGKGERDPQVQRMNAFHPCCERIFVN